MMTLPLCIPDIMAEMVRCSGNNLHDIRHLLDVYDYAVRIADGEELDPVSRYKLEISALVHDIACPVCREKYGNTEWRHQEEESGPILEEFLGRFDLPEDVRNSVVFNVCHHHSPGSAGTEDFQFLIEADLIVNAAEKGIGAEDAEKLAGTVFRSDTGKKLLREIAGCCPKETLPLEIERKWLVDVQSIPYELGCLEKRKIEQFYISVNPTIRARSVNGESFILTVKAGTGSELSRVENETPLSREEFEDLKPLMQGFPVKKTRYIHPLDNGLVEEIDIFEDNLEGLALMELEFPDTAAAESWPTPGWAVRDVTSEKKYKNGALALSGKVPEK